MTGRQLSDAIDRIRECLARIEAPVLRTEAEQSVVIHAEMIEAAAQAISIVVKLELGK